MLFPQGFYIFKEHQVIKRNTFQLEESQALYQPTGDVFMEASLAKYSQVRGGQKPSNPSCNKWNTFWVNDAKLKNESPNSDVMGLGLKLLTIATLLHKRYKFKGRT